VVMSVMTDDGSDDDDDDFSYCHTTALPASLHTCLTSWVPPSYDSSEDNVWTFMCVCGLFLPPPFLPPPPPHCCCYLIM